MSLKINHRREVLSGPVGWEHRRDPGQASGADLLWYFFPGDVEVVSGDVVLASVVGSVPALHFVAAMIEARSVLAAGDNSGYTYGFTEVEHYITFRRAGDVVFIECDFSPETITVPLDQFSREVCKFARREIEDLEGLHHELSAHPLVHNLLSKCDDG